MTEFVQEYLDENVSGKGLRAGVYDFLMDVIYSQGCELDYHKNIVFRIFLIKNTKWKDILKFLPCPKGTLIKKIRKVR
jgi:Fe-S cluster assembly iron-binding protein IscA